MKTLAASWLLLPLLARADFNEPDWRFRRPLQVSADGRVASLRIGEEICAHSAPRLSDLRLVRDGLEVASAIERGPEYQTFAHQTPAPREDAATRSTVVRLDLGAALPCDRVRLRVVTRWFHRAIDTDFSTDGRHWLTAQRSVIYRLPGDESLTTSFEEQWQRYLRLRIFNRDDLPLGLQQVSVEAREIRLKFLPASPGVYWLYYGDPRAHAPDYDLGRILAAQAQFQVVEVDVGAEQPNPVWRPVLPPWTERHPALLYIALAAAIAVLGGSTLRFWLRLRSAKTSPRGGFPSC